MPRILKHNSAPLDMTVVVWGGAESASPRPSVCAREELLHLGLSSGGSLKLEESHDGEIRQRFAGRRDEKKRTDTCSRNLIWSNKKCSVIRSGGDQRGFPVREHRFSLVKCELVYR